MKYFICALVLFVCMLDLKDHNKKLEELFPDINNDKHRNYRHELEIRFIGFGFLLILLLAFSVEALIRSLVS